MIIRKYNTLEALKKQAAQEGKEIYETNLCYSYRVYEKGITKIFHVFYKS